MPASDFTVRIIRQNHHKEGTQTWRAALIVTAMEGCEIQSIVQALTAFERTRSVGIQAPARWIRQFAGLESDESGKSMSPWLEVTHQGTAVTTREQFNELLSSRPYTDA